MCRCLAVALSLPHLGVGGFEVACVTRRVEQRRGVAIARELRFDRGKRVRFARQLQGEALIVLDRERR